MPSVLCLVQGSLTAFYFSLICRCFLFAVKPVVNVAICLLFAIAVVLHLYLSYLAFQLARQNDLFETRYFRKQLKEIIRKAELYQGQLLQEHLQHMEWGQALL
jgi:hypothetical protein